MPNDVRICKKPIITSIDNSKENIIPIMDTIESKPFTTLMSSNMEQLK